MEKELERVIETLTERLAVAREGSAAHRMVVRQLEGVRNSSQLAEQILEEHDYWGQAVHG
ncbi:MAG TPA: hypothetical protein VE200_04825 [Xanthobacteraceae bacterium]|jgi:hypothetical protein|nr:hypothetical protein [Xanthobacteraceae bacterium]